MLPSYHHGSAASNQFHIGSKRCNIASWRLPLMCHEPINCHIVSITSNDIVVQSPVVDDVDARHHPTGIASGVTTMHREPVGRQLHALRAIRVFARLILNKHLMLLVADTHEVPNQPVLHVVESRCIPTERCRPECSDRHSHLVGLFTRVEISTCGPVSPLHRV